MPPKINTASPALFNKLPLIQWLGSLVLAALATWGTIQYKNGSMETRVTATEKDVETIKTEQKIQLREIRENMVDRKEWNLFYNMYTKDTEEVKTSLRELSKEQRQR